MTVTDSEVGDGRSEIRADQLVPVVCSNQQLVLGDIVVDVGGDDEMGTILLGNPYVDDFIDNWARHSTL